MVPAYGQAALSIPCACSPDSCSPSVAFALADAPAPRRPAPYPANEIEAENCLPGTPREPVGRRRRRRREHPGLRDRHQRRAGRDGAVQGRHDRRELPARHLPDGLLRRRRRPLRPTVSPTAVRRTRPRCDQDGVTGLIDCGNWAVSASLDGPGRTRSRASTSRSSCATAAGATATSCSWCATTTARSDLLFQTSDTTWQAYNQYGGNSLYDGQPGRARVQGQLQPAVHHARRRSPEDWLFNAEYPMVRWLERNGYDVSYATGVDSDRAGAELREHRAFLSVGHDEYWSGTQRANVEAARDAGVNLAFFSGNEVFWKTRWENNHRTLVTYKETHANEQDRPASRTTWTGTWRDPRPVQPAGRPARERAHRHDLHGQLRVRGAPGAGRGRQAAPVARDAGGTAAARRRRDADRRQRSATSGTRTSTTGRARPGSSGSPRPP